MVVEAMMPMETEKTNLVREFSDRGESGGAGDRA
ncbi:hypothetical protein COLO4_22592 [Corchorus olitorius]|uniref:Uncharacterized protein n=1 Tax=Corchorus olitorius TaxID=93759 RepID=A0A1R3IL56_9ROSI|nr:hypothetical protein COLO4_22592 [Corchorus olitorius]